MSFVNLHQHTEYSLLDGAARIPDLVKRAKELGMKALAITDHGNMFGVIRFYKECRKEGIKPIIGCEVYTTQGSKEKKDPEICHLTLLCENDTGYKNLITIVSDAYTKGFYYKPRTDKASLRENHEGLIALSGCLAGKVQKLLLADKYEEAKKEALELEEIFGKGNFFLELQNHASREDEKVIPQIRKLSAETGIKLVATNDTHYINQEDAFSQELLMCLQMQKKLSEPHLKMEPEEYYLKGEKEMLSLFSYERDAVHRSGEIAERCNVEIDFGHYHIPAFQVPDGYENAYAFFKHLCEEGLKKRYKDITPELTERLNYEMETVRNMGYVEYLLIVWDYINFAKENGIMVGPGRGSAAGSLACYAMGITEIDPIKYNLIFERFLNPERVSMPDIDTDFCVRRRAEVIDYVTEKYGEDCVCQISTFGSMKAKMAIKDVARTFEVPYKETNEIAKLVPDDAKTIDDALRMQPKLKDIYNNNTLMRKVIDNAIKLESIPRNVSTHAAGVVISSDPIKSYIPLVKTDKGIATQHTMTEIEEQGALKMDFLGLRNLTAIEDCIKMVKENTGEDIDLDKIDFADQNIYNMISEGKTVGVFQLESKGITDFMMNLKPTCFEDIIAGIALYRPGPMDSIPDYIENKKHPDKIRYITPELAPILDVTYGIIVYQEEVMQIVRDLGGYSYGRSDLVRRAMSKKKHDVMMEEKEYFIHGKTDDKGNIEIPGCVRNGISETAAEKIFDQMISFAEYAFNKSHATAYAVITYQTAWLKYYYPAEFMAALMTSEKNNHDHLSVYIKEARTIKAPNGRKIKVLPPSVLESKVDFVALPNHNIRFGLAAIKGVGDSACEDIVSIDKTGLKGNLRKFLESLDKKSLNSKTMEGLLYSGALSGLVPSIHAASMIMESAINNAKKAVETAESGQMSMFDTAGMSDFLNVEYPEAEEYPKDRMLGFEKEYLGFYVTGHPLDAYEKFIRKCTKDTDKLKIVAGVITNVKTIITKKLEQMAFVSIDGLEESYEITVFPRQYKASEELLKEGELIAVKGKPDGGSILADIVAKIDMMQSIENPTTYNNRYLKIVLHNNETAAEVASFLQIAKDGLTRVVIYDSQIGKPVYREKLERGVAITPFELIKINLKYGEENVKLSN